MVAQKDYTCDLCALQILAGTVYFKYLGKPWDACGNLAFFTLRYHPGCKSWLAMAAAMPDGKEGTDDNQRDEYRERRMTPQQARRATNALVGARKGIAEGDDNE